MFNNNILTTRVLAYHLTCSHNFQTIFTHVPVLSPSWTCHTWGRVSLLTTGDIAQGQGRCGGWQFEVLSSHGSPVGTVSSWQHTYHRERTAPSVWSAEMPQRSSWCIQWLCTAVPVWGEHTTKFMATSKYSSFELEQALWETAGDQDPLWDSIWISKPLVIHTHPYLSCILQTLRHGHGPRRASRHPVTNRPN